jgi:putative Mg2+ transporter-C (MgtC) family protein
VRDLLDAELDRAAYPIRDVETRSEQEDQVELAAILVPSTAKDAELDAVVSALQASPLVRSASWTVSAVA